MQILTISSPSFPDGALIPVIHTGYGADPVSYTHLDVYKRQLIFL